MSERLPGTLMPHDGSSSRPGIESHDNDPDFDELIAAAQDVVETGLQSSDGRHCIVSEVAIERLRKALEPRK